MPSLSNQLTTMSAKFTTVEFVNVDDLSVASDLSLVIVKNNRAYNGIYYSNITLRYTLNGSRFSTSTIKLGSMQLVKKIYTESLDKPYSLKMYLKPSEDDTSVYSALEKIVNIWTSKLPVSDDKTITHSIKDETDDYEKSLCFKIENGNFSDKHPNKKLRSAPKFTIQKENTAKLFGPDIAMLNEDDLVISEIYVDINSSTTSENYYSWIWSARKVVVADGI